MKLLLDTCAFLWLVTDEPRLTGTAKDLFLDAGNELLLSAVTGFEITVKHSLGKLQLAESSRSFIANRLRANALTELHITLEHAVALQDLPLHHKDPFDRLLVAQAITESVPLLSSDEQLSAYPIERIWS